MKIVVVGFLVVSIVATIVHGGIGHSRWFIESSYVHPSKYLVFARPEFSKNSFKNNNKVDDVNFLVSLRRNGKHDCQGSIIASDVIIAPAHCVKCEATSNPDLQVLAGTKDFTDESSGKLYEVSNITCNDNIAFLKLAMNISPNQEIIRLPVRRQQAIKDDDSSSLTRFLVAWNLTGNNFKKIVKKSTAATRDLCFKEFKELNPQNYICTRTTIAYDICKGNNDAVMISNNTIIGMSTKIGCNKKIRKFDIFTRVEPFLQGIASRLEKL